MFSIAASVHLIFHFMTYKFVLYGVYPSSYSLIYFIIIIIIIIVTPIITKGLRSVNKDDKLANYDVDGVGDYNMRSLIKEEKLKNKLYEGWVIYIYIHVYIYVCIDHYIIITEIIIIIIIIAVIDKYLCTSTSVYLSVYLSIYHHIFI